MLPTVCVTQMSCGLRHSRSRGRKGADVPCAVSLRNLSGWDGAYRAQGYDGGLTGKS